MKKYVVRVQYTGTECNDVCLVKAKNNNDLELIMAKFLAPYTEDIDGFEYVVIKRKDFYNYRWQKRNPRDLYIALGNWVGAEWIKEILDNGIQK